VLQVTQTPLAADFPDFAAARAYDAAFYVASALLLAGGETFRSHREMVALIHRDKEGFDTADLQDARALLEALGI
jgi:uncharacterized protein (UPF0332 family)